jgi:membrane protease YdiL (CAAX protease family)
MTPKPRSFKTAISWIFVGSKGIRAGWSMAIFVLIVSIASTPFALLANKYGLKPATELSPWQMVAVEAASLLVVLVATWVMGRIERRKLKYYGFTTARPLTHFAWGFAGGFLCLSALAAVLGATGNLVFDGMALHGALPAAGFGLVWLLAFTLVGFTEESMFRGYLQTTLTRGIGFWPAAVLMSALFGAAHLSNKGESVAGITEVVVAGLVLCTLLRVSGSLWLSIGFHAAWDWAQSYFYGTPDSGFLAHGHLLSTHPAGDIRLSGGSAGPEGSVLAPVVMVTGMLVLIFVCQRAGLFAAAQPAPDLLRRQAA